METLDRDKVLKFYTETSQIWAENDHWHCYSYRTIKRLIYESKLPENYYILNAGSGGNDYGLKNRMHHVDIAENKINKTEEYTVTSIESLPFENNTFDAVLCVGSVINYCDPFATLLEFHRVLKPRGILLLEFENSYSFEYLGKRAYKSNESIIKCIFQGLPHQNWVYSYKHIFNILEVNGFKINVKKFFHVLSTLFLRMGFSEKTSSFFASTDCIVSHCPILKTHSGNVFVKCTKI